MNRIVSWLLVVALFLTLTMPAAMAADEKKSGDFFYRIKGNGTAVITGYDWNGNQGKDIYIPNSLDGYTVTEIAEEAFARIQRDENDLIDISRSRGNKAGALIIPNTIVYIGQRAFMGIEFSTESITIPQSVQYIGAGAFSWLIGIQQFVVSGDNPVYATIDGILYNKTQKELVACPYYAGEVFLYKSHLDSRSAYQLTVSIPNGIKSIGAYACFGVRTDVFFLPSTLETIGDYAFAQAEVLTFLRHNQEYYVTNSLSSHLVAYSSGLQAEVSWAFPDSIKKIGKGAFAAQDNDKEPSSMIFGLDLTNTSIKEIPPFAFSGRMNSLRSIVGLPKHLEKVDMYAFEDFGGTMIWPETLQEIGDYAFARTSFQDDLDLSMLTSLQRIGRSAFEKSSFRKLILPKGLEVIDDYAFSNNSSLKYISLPASITSLGDDLCDKYKVTLSVEAGSYASIWASENGYMLEQSVEEDTSWLSD